MRLYVKRLRDKYGKDNIAGKKYQQVINDILLFNNENIARQISKQTNKKMEDNFIKTLKEEEKLKIVKFPDINKILPNKELNIRKQAIKGDMITQTLRDRLNKDLREAITLKTYKGKITKQQSLDFKKNITNTFKEYTVKQNKEMPNNIQTIATTEIRSAVNEIRHEYISEFRRQNPYFKLKKTWIHKNRAKTFRHGHELLDGKTIDIDDNFKIVIYKKVGKRNLNQGFVFANRPHDLSLPASEVINCSCELEYKIL